MIVTRSNFNEVIEKLSNKGFYSLDTETTGLKWYENDKLFSIIIASKENVYYFNFWKYIDVSQELTLPREWIIRIGVVLANPQSTWFLHNAKFDMAMLKREGLDILGTVHCTEAHARLIRSDHMSYSLEHCLRRMNLAKGIKGIEKDDAVKKYITKHKLYIKFLVPGKKKPITEKYFHKVPFDIIVPYGEDDARGTRELGLYQIAVLNKKLEKHPELHKIIVSERALTKTCFEMEHTGVAIDVPYVDKQLNEALDREKILYVDFKNKTGLDFKDSNVLFAKYFDGEGVKYPRTEKGNPSFKADKLHEIKHPVARIIEDIRTYEKVTGTYYSSYQYFGATGRIHANARQSGTAPGRMSYSSPNLQNVPKFDPDEPAGNEIATAVRRCYVPDPGFCFFLPDYDQMEYRMMIDQAGEHALIAKVNAGVDVHQATADLMGVSRKVAKTINFLLLYGGGAAKLAAALGISLAEAYELKAIYFASLPNVKIWIDRTIFEARRKGYVKNWAGRVVNIDPNFAYKAPNYIIQGGCADVVKFAMNKLALGFANKRSAMLLQIHDELMIGLHKEELDLAPKIIEVMENIYPSENIKLTVGPKHSWKNWADYVEGLPVAA